MKETYTYQELIYALRKEYLEVQKQIEEMEKHIIMENEKYTSSLYFESSDTMLLF